MKKDKKQEELQSRRQFFKKAAKGVLPFLGAIVLVNPVMASTVESMGCRIDACTGTCAGSCKGTCESCSHSCSSSCMSGCIGSSKSRR